GVAQHAIAIDTPLEAERLHRKLLATSAREDARRGRGEAAAVEIVIIGAGATGVEFAAEVRQTLRALRLYGLDHLDPARDVKLTILEAAPRILPPLPERIAEAAATLLEELAIQVHVDEKVVSIDA